MVGTSFEAEQASSVGQRQGLGKGQRPEGKSHTPSVWSRGPQMQLRPEDEGAGAGLKHKAQKVGVTKEIAVGRFWVQL